MKYYPDPRPSELLVGTCVHIFIFYLFGGGLSAGYNANLSTVTLY